MKKITVIILSVLLVFTLSGFKVFECLGSMHEILFEANMAIAIEIKVYFFIMIIAFSYLS